MYMCLVCVYMIYPCVYCVYMVCVYCMCVGVCGLSVCGLCVCLVCVFTPAHAWQHQAESPHWPAIAILM